MVDQSDVAPDPVRFVEALKDIPFDQLGEVIGLVIEWNNEEEIARLSCLGAQATASFGLAPHANY